MPDDVRAAITESLESLKAEFDIEETDRILIHGSTRRINHLTWRIILPAEVNGKAEFIEAYIIFTEGFPYEMPGVIIPDDRFRYLPHISSDTRKLCLYEDGIEYDADNIYGLIRDNIDKAKQWIKKYTSRDNTDEYAREIASYWVEAYDGEDDVDGYWTMMGYIPDHTCELKGIAYVTRDGKKGNTRIEFVVSTDDNTEVLANLSEKHSAKEFTALYLCSFEMPNQPPFSLTGKSLVDRIKDENEKKELKRYLNRQGDGYVLFPIGIDNKLGGVHLHQLKTNRPGFRHGVISPFQALTEFEGKSKKYPRLMVSVYNESRIAERTAGELMDRRSFLVAGLGSVGSNLCYYLNGYNNARFTLVDKDKLTPENIGRHLLGFVFQHQYKVTAVAEYLKGYRPDREVKGDRKKLQELSADEINLADGIFVCTGDVMSERWLLKQMKGGMITKPAFVMWLEPYGISGILLYVNPSDRESVDKLLVLSEKGFEDYCLIASEEYGNGEKLTQEDAGCNGKYAVYSANDVTFFLSAMFPVIDRLLGEPTQSKVYRWVGNIEIAEQKDIRIVSTDCSKHMFQELPV